MKLQPNVAVYALQLDIKKHQYGLQKVTPYRK